MVSVKVLWVSLATVRCSLTTALTDTGNREAVVETSGGLERNPLDVAVGQGRRDAEVRLTMDLCKDQADVPLLGRLRVFDGEKFVWSCV